MLQAQSNMPQRDLWVIGKNVVNFDINLGTQTTVNQLPIHPQTITSFNQPNPTTMYLNNAYHDESGNLLFYIADGKVYDFEGRYIGTLNTSAGTTVYGYKDIAIVPDKCNPSVFYIVAIIDRANGHNGQSSTPLFAKLEIGLDINANTFDNQQNAGFSGDPLADGRLGFATSNYASGTGFPEMLPLLSNNTGGENESMFTFAVSKRQADGEYLLFTSSGNEIAIIKGSDLAAAGNSNNLPATLFSNISFGNQNPNSECELFQATGSSTIRVANSRENASGGNPQGKYYYQDFTYLAGAITANPSVLLLDILDNNTGWHEHGLEFSENGQYLYFTASRVVSQVPNVFNYRFNYFDLSQANPVSQNITNTQLNYSVFNSFVPSQIELGKDGAFYLWSGTQLGRLVNTNNPTSIVPSNFTAINLPIADQTNFDLVSGDTHMMNDQVDGEPAYTPFVVNNSPEDKQCCIDQKRYTKDYYTVNAHTTPITNQVWGTNQVWSPGSNPFNNTTGIVSVKNRLTIPAGYTVTINNMTFEYKIFLDDPINTTTFVDGAKCIIERSTNTTDNGGVLILNNTIFKSIYACEGMWDGIEVQGDPNAVQQTITSSPFMVKSKQAKLIVNAGSIIQDAYFGAANYQFDLTNGNGIFFQTNLASSGGIIIANNSTFKNNFIGTIFLPYSTANVISKFTNTNFLVDAPLKNPLITPLTMAFLLGNKNLPFTACNFKNLIASPNTSPYPVVPSSSAVVGLHGILSFDATFSVRGAITFGMQYGVGCTFENLAYGIRAFNWTANTALVQSSTFINNWRGSYFGNYSGTSVTKVQRNKYFVYEQPYTTPAIDAAYGHYLDYCNNFIVQENRFYYNSFNESSPATIGGQYNAYGLIVNEENAGAGCILGYQGDQVYKNLFKEINIGSQNQGSNSERPADAQNFTGGCNNNVSPNNQGLKYVCNTYAGTDENDISVVPNSQNNTAGRIAYQQGVISAPAGNVFSHVSGCTSFLPSNSHEIYIDNTNITNSNPNYVNYTHQSSLPTTPNCFSPYRNSAGIPNGVPNTGSALTTVNYANTCPTKLNTNSFITNISLFRSLGKTADLVNQPLLAGDAETLMTVIATSNSGQIQNVLQPKSPYLSDRVLLELINSNVSTGVLKNILIANSPLSQRVKDAFLAMNLPNGIKNQVNAAQVGESPRELLEAQVAIARDSRHTYGIEAMHQLLSDTAVVITDSIIKLTEELGGSETHCERLKIYTAVKDTVKARQQSELMVASGDVDVVCTFLMKLSAAYSKYNVGALGVTKDIETMDAIYAARTENTAADSRGAEGVLQAFRKNPYTEWVQAKNNTSAGARMAKVEDVENIKTIQNRFIKLYPNPSSGIFKFELLVNEDLKTKTAIEVYNSTGNLVKQISLNNGENNGYIDLSEFSSGIYFVNVINSNIIVSNSKINVIK